MATLSGVHLMRSQSLDKAQLWLRTMVSPKTMIFWKFSIPNFWYSNPRNENMSKKLPTYFCQKERSMVGGVKGSLQNFQKIICFGFFLCPLFANPPSQVCLHCTLCCAQSQQDHRQLMFGFGLGEALAPTMR